MENSVKQVAIYLRVSSDKQAKLGDSIREQEETLTDYVNRTPGLVKYRTYVDDGVSGQKLDRDEFTQLMNDVKSNKIDMIVFTKLDRWFRSLRHYLNTQALLDSHNVTWLAVSQPYFNTDTPHGRAFIAQSMAFAELEAQNDGIRIRDVFKNKVHNGEVISGNVLLGHKIVNKHIELDESTAPAVKATFEHFSKTSNIAKTTEMLLNTYGIDRYPSTVRRMLKNKKYIGIFRDNNNYCPPIVDKDTFYHVQELLSKNIPAFQKHQYIFSGLVVCGTCGKRITACQVSVSGHVRKDGTRPHYKHSMYKCKYHLLNKCTSKKTIYESVLEKYLVSEIKNYISDYITKYEVKTAPIVNSTNKRNTINKKLFKLKDLYLNDLISLDEYKSDKLLYESQLKELDEPVPVKDLSPLKEILKLDVESIYNRLSFEEKVTFWRAFIDKIILHSDGKIDIVFL